MEAININKIVQNGFCIGCGACAIATDQKIQIRLNQYGCYEPVLTTEPYDEQKALHACPFSNNGPNEDQLGETLFNTNQDVEKDLRLGHYRSLYMGHVEEGSYREKATSGGVISWLLATLLEKDLVDFAIHVKPADRSKEGKLFKYDTSDSPESVLVGAKSRYYPVEISEALERVKSIPGRYVFVGLPCFVKAIRRLMISDPVIQERILFCVGLVCGHLKSTAFAENFAWQAGIAPKELEEVDFRVKLKGRTAGDYGVYVRGSEKTDVRATRSYFGYNWGHNFFRYAACNYCDDVFAETADVVVGDAWLPQYAKDSRGTSLVIVRNELLGALFDEARAEKRVSFDEVSADQMATSQAGGLRDRREGLAYRLYLKKEKNEWIPHKRVEPNGVLSRQRKKIYQLRIETEKKSHEAWVEAVKRGSYEWFRKELFPYVKKCNRLYCPLYKRLVIISCKVLRNPRVLVDKIKKMRG